MSYTPAHSLSNEEVSRYSRQMLLPEIGVTGQEKLRSAKILVVGAGGLGCPAVLYLAGAGVGTIGIVDFDTVEISNLHRQIAHATSRVGMNKALSVAESAGALNPLPVLQPHQQAFDSRSAPQLLPQYDVVLDASDNVATRYLLNDACFLQRKPLVSGAATRFEGQLTVYHTSSRATACYRCLFPVPPPPDTVTSCSDGGVLGVVPGIIGSLQALEALKLVLGIGDVCAGSLLIFDALSLSFRKVRLRPPQSSCRLCGTQPEITELIDYVQFCGELVSPSAPPQFCLSPPAYASYREGQAHTLLDVRVPIQFQIAALPASLNIPLSELESRLAEVPPDQPVVCVCRRGRDSALAVLLLAKHGYKVLHIEGGLDAWRAKCDPNFPVY